MYGAITYEYNGGSNMNSNTSERNLLGNKIVLRVTVIISLARCY